MNQALPYCACSIRCWKEHEANQTIRFQSAKLSPNGSSLRACGVPATAGNRALSSLTAWQGVFFAFVRHSGQTRAFIEPRRLREGRLFFDSSRSILVPYASMGACSGQWNTQSRIARKGAGGGRGTVETPAHELPVNEAHTRSNAKAGRTPAFDGARAAKRHKCTTSRESRIKGQAVRLRARAAGRKACPEMVAVFPLNQRQKWADSLSKSMVAACRYESSSYQ